MARSLLDTLKEVSDDERDCIAVLERVSRLADDSGMSHEKSGWTTRKAGMFSQMAEETKMKVIYHTELYAIFSSMGMYYYLFGSSLKIKLV